MHGDSLCVYKQYQPTNALYNSNSICMLCIWIYVHRILNENWMFNANAYMCPKRYLFTWNVNENCDAFIKNMHYMGITYAMRCNVCLCLKRHSSTWYVGKTVMHSIKHEWYAMLMTCLSLM